MTTLEQNARDLARSEQVVADLKAKNAVLRNEVPRAVVPTPAPLGIDPRTGQPYAIQPGIDPVTGVPYTAEQINPVTNQPYVVQPGIDPATGVPYYAEQAHPINVGTNAEVSDLRASLWNTKNDSEVRAIASEISTRTNSTMSEGTLKQVSAKLNAAAGNRAEVLKIADELAGRTEAVIRLDVLKETSDRFRKDANSHLSAMRTAEDITRTPHPTYGAEQTALCDRFRNAGDNHGTLLSICDEVDAMDAPKRMVERFRPIANDKVQIFALAGFIGQDLVPPPDGHPNADLSGILKRLVNARDAVAVIAICDEVAARQA